MAEYPTHLAHIWEWYKKLSRTRQNGMAVNPISHAEILAFCTLRNIRMSPSEVDILLEIDAVSIQQSSEGK